jgi:hypothetical protein
MSPKFFFFFAEEGSHNPYANTTAVVRRKNLSFTSGASVEGGIGKNHNTKVQGKE